jgi:hypothetical protein
MFVADLDAAAAGLGVGAASGDSCDPTVENCSETNGGDKAAPPVVKADGHEGAGTEPTQGSNSEGFYDRRPTPSVGGGSAGAMSSPGVGGAAGGPSSPIQYDVDAGVEQWRQNVEIGLERNGLPTSLADQVLYQMQTESSGNPNAINNWDSNAQKGTPSGGLLQTIGPTYDSYKLPGAGDNMFDPQDNIDAAINYAQERYGPTLMNENGGMGSGRGY